MRGSRQIFIAMLLILSISSITFAGTITGSRTSRTGTITGSRVGTITGSKSGTITGSRRGTITGSRLDTVPASTESAATKDEWLTRLASFVLTLYF